jgi:hypothetical protein
MVRQRISRVVTDVGARYKEIAAFALRTLVVEVAGA